MGRVSQTWAPEFGPAAPLSNSGAVVCTCNHYTGRQRQMASRHLWLPSLAKWMGSRCSERPSQNKKEKSGSCWSRQLMLTSGLFILVLTYTCTHTGAHTRVHTHTNVHPQIYVILLPNTSSQLWSCCVSAILLLYTLIHSVKWCMYRVV